MRLWAQTEAGQMFSVKLRMDRTIYINSKNQQASTAEFKKVTKTLPRAR
jgi:hypothetical protein